MTQKVKPSTLADTTVTAGTYGGSTQQAVITVDAQGRLTYAANAVPSVANTQVTGLITNTQIASVANTKITGDLTSVGVSATVSSNTWTITPSATKISFAFNGTTVFSVDSSGNLIARGTITNSGTP